VHVQSAAHTHTTQYWPDDIDKQKSECQINESGAVTNTEDVEIIQYTLKQPTIAGNQIISEFLLTNQQKRISTFY